VPQSKSPSPFANHPLLHLNDRNVCIPSSPTEILWHFSDTSAPESIIASGFTARNPAAKISLENWSKQLVPAQFVSTTRNRFLSRDFPVYSDRRYRFKITASDNSEPFGVDVNATLGRGAKFNDEQEVAFLGGIDPRAVTSVYDEALDRTGRWDHTHNNIQWTAGDWQNPAGPDQFLTGERLTLSSPPDQLLDNDASREVLRGFTSAVLQAAQNGPVKVYVDDPQTHRGSEISSMETAVRSLIPELRGNFRGETYPIAFESTNGLGESRMHGASNQHTALIHSDLHPDQHVGSRLGYFLRGNMLVDPHSVGELLGLHSRIGKDIRGLDERFANKVGGHSMKESIERASSDGLLDRNDARPLISMIDSGYIASAASQGALRFSTTSSGRGSAPNNTSTPRPSNHPGGSKRRH
jgi:hypothetical protein